MILKIVPKAASNFCSGFPLFLTGQFFPVYKLYIHSRLLEQFSGSQAVYGTTLRGQAAIRKPEQAL
jgi:hypothetical protein